MIIVPGRFTPELLEKKGSSNFDEQTAVLALKSWVTLQQSA